MAAVAKLLKVTSRYDPVQDRFFMRGSDAEGGTHKVWLTRRLLERLIPELCRWLEASDAPPATPRVEALHAFKQQAARQNRQQVEEVPEPDPQPAEDQTRSQMPVEWLACEVSVQAKGKALALEFRPGASAKGGPVNGPEGGVEPVSPTAGLDFTPVSLRQWLDILIRGYRQAQWPLSCWPGWARDGTELATGSAQLALH